MANEPTKPTLQTRRSPSHRVTYANQIGITTSPTEVRLRFAVVEQIDGRGGMTIEDQVDVVMVPIIADQLRQLLSRTLPKQYGALVQVPDEAKKNE